MGDGFHCQVQVVLRSLAFALPDHSVLAGPVVWALSVLGVVRESIELASSLPGSSSPVCCFGSGHGLLVALMEATFAPACYEPVEWPALRKAGLCKSHPRGLGRGVWASWFRQPSSRHCFWQLKAFAFPHKTVCLFPPKLGPERGVFSRKALEGCGGVWRSGACAEKPALGVVGGSRLFGFRVGGQRELGCERWDGNSTDSHLAHSPHTAWVS